MSHPSPNGPGTNQYGKKPPRLTPADLPSPAAVAAGAAAATTRPFGDARAEAAMRIRDLDIAQRQEADPARAQVLRQERDELAMSTYGEPYCNHESRGPDGRCECGDESAATETVDLSDAPCCDECGEPMAIDASGVTRHLEGGDFGEPADADADHAPYSSEMCVDCGGLIDDGEGYDGRCGDCADTADPGADVLADEDDERAPWHDPNWKDLSHDVRSELLDEYRRRDPGCCADWCGLHVDHAGPCQRR